ncbi:beta carbonic anhydrase 5, chloroplastic isoform X1 [Arachis ipaensis]|uniref:beta carbonic anhydrase 5, chloroplastic isoform X1 n=1 Tax=Arachis ipaensis TaxID=130454 RepID=UPI0007AFAB55|nr:beta carbonic anhydrase 5, chloroplastic isoform X1 [Arachis ipaensis]XP_025667945.1 beta carbonic anhydrase 5, chloroplastic isoform X1 [Arachis hypogaea]
MAWSIRSRVSSLLRSEVRVVGSLFHWDTCWRTVPFSVPTNSSSAISSRTRPWPKFMNWARMDSCYAAASFKEKQSENKDTDVWNMAEAGGDHELFGLMKQRFLSFKNHKYMKELEHFQALSKAQYPKFMVIACADSRVCPSNILGFQPGEAFMIRNIANLVPLMKNGPSECNAALEFAVTTLEVENILVIGHSSCAGIENLMKIQEDVESRSFINKWVTNGNVAKLRTKAATAHLSFAQQCRFCEKESINQSLLNMLSYPWIEDKVRSGLLSLHGGYYNFSSCTFEKWTLDFNGCTVNEESSSYAIKEQEFWS